MPEDPADPADPPGRLAGSSAAELSLMRLVEVSVDLPDPFAIAVLEEQEAAGRILQIPLGIPDATALAHAFRRVPAPRPLSHELFAEVLRRLLIDVVALRIVGRRSGTYLAELEVAGPRGREVFTCRPSDGMSLALRQTVPAPILADVRLMTSVEDV